MSRFFLSGDKIDTAAGCVCITGDDAHHIGYALRMAVGDPLTVATGDGTEYLCTITEIRPDRVTLRIDSARANDTELPVEVHLYQSVPKGDKMEYIVQKAVELGATSVTPVMSTRCIVRLDAKNAETKRVRWQRIAEEAAKQCGRGRIPEVRQAISFGDAIRAAGAYDMALFCYEGEGTVSLKELLVSAMEKTKKSAPTGGHRSFAVFIGPEGGYDPAEARAAEDAGMCMTNLGKRILRCETASGLVLASMVYAFEL